jgi:hypothetical protein
MALVLLPFNECASNGLRIKNEYKFVPLPKRHILKAYRDVKVHYHILLASEICGSTSELWDRVPSARWNGGFCGPYSRRVSLLGTQSGMEVKVRDSILRPWILHCYISITEAITLLVSTA